MELVLRPNNVSLRELDQIYRQSDTLSLPPDCREQVEASNGLIRKAAAGSEPVYGVNTGFGKLAHTRIDHKDTAQLQRNLILSHCCGVGDPLSPRIVRLVMALKLVSLARGASGVRWDVLLLLRDMLNKGVIPVVPGQGSVGASGDLAPLAHLTAAMIGEGMASIGDRVLPGSEALKKAGLEPIALGPKEGLAMINGTQVSTALALGALFDVWSVAQVSLISGALSTDAAMGSSAPFRPEIHALRGQPGQIAVAGCLRSLMQGSEIRESHRDGDERVQDPYCLRCQPQVAGACLDLLRQAGRTLRIEANAVTDNPLVFPESDSILSGGNFHAEPVAFAADQIALAIAELGSIAQRRIAMLVDPALNFGLPAFLSPRPGLNSGFMIAEVTTAALMSENKQKANPCSVDSTPTSANQEDHVSMAAHGARRLFDMNRNLAGIVGVELLTGAQGVELRGPLTTSPALQRVIAHIRRHVPSLGEDRFMADDLSQAAGLAATDQLIHHTDRGWFPDLEG